MKLKKGARHERTNTPAVHTGSVRNTYRIFPGKKPDNNTRQRRQFTPELPVKKPTLHSPQDLMRISFFSILLLASTTIAQATIQPEALRKLAYEGNFQAVDDAMAAAHQESLTGEISYDDLGNVFLRTHPDMDDFRALWLENLPDSPYAQMATAWSLYNHSFSVRGGAFARDTPPAALDAFRELQREAAALTVRAYDTAPDYVPASDGIIRIQLSAGIMMGWLFRGVVKDIMETTPNYGTLERLSSHALVHWGGRGQRDIVNLCDAYFDRLPEYPDLTYEICLVSLLAYNDMLEPNWSFVADVLDRENHELLTMARLERALARRTDEDLQILMDYLDNTRFDEPWIRDQYRIASSFARIHWNSRYQEVGDFMADFQPRFYTEIMTELARNPFNLTLLEIIIEDDNRRRVRLTRADPLQIGNYKLRRAFLQPYHKGNWSAAVAPYAELGNPTVLNTYDMPLYNAVAYSNHDIFAIRHFLFHKIEQYERFRDPIGTRGFRGWSEHPDEDIIREIGCRVATLIRLFDDAAKRHPEHINSIDGFRINHNLDEAELRTVSACDYVWSATIGELRFEPIELQARYLLVIPDSTPFAPHLGIFERNVPSARR
ncbi:hypothetical protein [Yoonia sp. BS5-3]|uniref:DUF4034 domain-containing protein n=1 Tax=Yoonia phaeophyticola TaxID=3137369 RepID=A0ABZ2V6K9_9RHOB